MQNEKRTPIMVCVFFTMEDIMIINGETEVLGVLGNPIKHTFSPDIHNALSKRIGINAVYLPFRVDGSLDNVIKGAFAANVKGLNVTVPFKCDVIPFLESIDKNAIKIGAVNTLVRGKKGYIGYNTDAPGLFRALVKLGVDISNKKAIILGAGGASRAVAAMLVMHGVECIYVINRTKEKAEKIAELSNKIVPLTVDEYKKVPKGKYLFFQCTSLGLKEEDSLLIEEDSFYDMAEYGFDLVYNPAMTPFTRMMENKNVPYNNGLYMLIYQAVIAYELWNDVKVEDETVEYVVNLLRKKIYGDNIILTGYMGSGKTSVGMAIARKLGLKMIDTDAYIEDKKKIYINEFFNLYGEEAFRNIETEILRELCSECFNTVISTGGGMPLSRINRDLMHENGNVIYLTTESNTIFERLKDDSSRPLLKTDNGESLMNKINFMIEKRRPYYECGADIIVSTDGKTPEQIADEIITLIHR